MPGQLRVVDLGRMGYAQACQLQCETADGVLRARARGSPEPGCLLLVEHDPVVTIGRRPGAGTHLIASAEHLAEQGVEVVETDRGGDVTYHGPGQVVAYPILDLNLLALRPHDYIRALEGIAIDTCARFGVPAWRDPSATGVWVHDPARPASERTPGAKVCAIGVRIRRWVSMHGLALNVHTRLDHFGWIVPCGLAGRPVTSLRAVLADRCPGTSEVRHALAERFDAFVTDRLRAASALRDATPA